MAIERQLVLSVTIGILVLFSTEALSAQGPLQIRIAPRIGVIDPGERLYTSVSQAQGGGVSSSAVAFGSSKSVGLVGSLGSEPWGVALQVSVSHVPNMDGQFIAMAWPPPSGVGIGHVFRSDLSASVTELGADLVLPLRIEIGPLRPFAVAGLGITRYRFSPLELGVTPQRHWVLPVSGTASSHRWGGGVAFAVLGQAFSLSLIDRVGSYYDEAQHHLFASLDIWVSLFN